MLTKAPTDKESCFRKPLLFGERVLVRVLIEFWRKGLVTSRRLLAVLLRNNERRFIAAMTSMEELDGIRAEEILAEYQDSTIGPRLYTQEGLTERRVHFAGIFYRLIENCVIHSQSSSVYVQRKVAFQPGFEKLFSRMRYRNGFIFFHDEKYAACYVKDIRSIEQGIFIGGDGSFNWYHWLIEILPKLYLLERLSCISNRTPILIPEEATSIATFVDTLNLFSGGREIILLSSKYAYRVENLVWIDSCVLSPFNFRDKVWPEPGDCRFHGDALRYFRQAVLERVPIRNYKGPRRVFLARPKGRRSYNESDVVNVIRKFGIIPVSMETLSFSEQVNIFNNAEFVVGPTGAAWANILFGRSDGRALCWMPSNFSAWSSFSDLAGIAGVDMRYIWTQPVHAINSSELSNAQYQIDIQLLEHALTSMLN
jgi:hypothetical protein